MFKLFLMSTSRISALSNEEIEAIEPSFDSIEKLQQAGINIADITASSALESAIKLGSGWDNQIYFTDITSPYSSLCSNIYICIWCNKEIYKSSLRYKFR